MGQRSDDFLHAWNGLTVNWDRFFGAGFKASPKRWVSVYREASLDELIRIARDGMRATPPEAMHQDARDEMALLDRYRPRRIARLGLSRRSSIVALPSPDAWHAPQRKERIVLELRVDPGECFVGDADVRATIIPFAGDKWPSARYRTFYEKYWEGIVTLREFQRAYGRVETPEGPHWVAKSGAAKRLPQTFFVPEIMIMTPHVSRSHIRIVPKMSFADPSDLFRERPFDLIDGGWE